MQASGETDGRLPRFLFTSKAPLSPTKRLPRMALGKCWPLHEKMDDLVAGNEPTGHRR